MKRGFFFSLSLSLSSFLSHRTTRRKRRDEPSRFPKFFFHPFFFSFFFFPFLMKRNTSGTGSLFPRTFLAYEQEASATNARIGRSRKFQRFHPFFHEQRGDARPAIVTSCNPFSTFSLSLSLFLCLRFSAEEKCKLLYRAQ